MISSTVYSDYLNVHWMESNVGTNPSLHKVDKTTNLPVTSSIDLMNGFVFE